MSDSQPEGMSLEVFNTANPNELIDVLKKLKGRELKLLFANNKFALRQL